MQHKNANRFANYVNAFARKRETLSEIKKSNTKIYS